MANTIAKRTFFEGCYIELFQRNDGGHRVKFVTPNGDEVTLNLDTKGWAKCDPNNLFESMAFSDDPINFSGVGVGSKLPHNMALWRLLANCDHYIKNVVCALGTTLAGEFDDIGSAAKAGELTPVAPKELPSRV